MTVTEFSPAPEAATEAPSLPRVKEVEDAIRKILIASDRTEASSLLPAWAVGEPGAFLNFVYEGWQDLARTRDSEAHSIRRLQKWLEDEARPVKSLHHKLKGRLPVTKIETESILRVFFSHWRVDRSGSVPKPIPFEFPHVTVTGKNIREPVTEGVNYTVETAAIRVTDILFGPISGLDRGSGILTVKQSPGIDTASFFDRHQNDRVIIIPVLDHVMYGDDPVAALHGTRTSLASCLTKENGSVKVVWLLRSAHAQDTLDYVKYLYERSFLATLFQYIWISVEKKWRFSNWSLLSNRLFVCIYKSENPIGKRAESLDVAPEDLVPLTPPYLWRTANRDFSFENFGFVVTIPTKDTAEYWSHTKPTKSPVVLFDRIDVGAEKPMVEAHLKLADVVEQKASRGRDKSLSGWDIFDADAFIKGADLGLGLKHQRPLRKGAKNGCR